MQVESTNRPTNTGWAFWSVKKFFKNLVMNFHSKLDSRPGNRFYSASATKCTLNWPEKITKASQNNIFKKIGRNRKFPISVRFKGYRGVLNRHFISSYESLDMIFESCPRVLAYNTHHMFHIVGLRSNFPLDEMKISIPFKISSLRLEKVFNKHMV